MKIRFETTIDDVIAFNRFHFANSPAWRRQVWTQMLLFPGILGIVFLLAQAGRDPFDDNDFFYRFVGALFLVVSIVWAIGIRWYMNWSLGRNTRKFRRKAPIARCSVGANWKSSIIAFTSRRS